MSKEYISVSPELATNINLMRTDSEFVAIEKAEVADAMYGIMTAKENIEDKRTLERLQSAMNVITNYLFYIDLCKE